MRTFVKTKIVEYYQCTDCEAKFPTLGVAKKHKCSGAVEAVHSTSTNTDSPKLRQIIIELGKRGVIGASDRDTAIVDEICKREGIIL